MKAKYFAVVLVVLVLAGFCAPQAYAAVTVDTIGTQFGVKSFMWGTADTVAAFRAAGKNSSAVAADSGASAGDSSSHIFTISVAAAGGGETVDSIMVMFPRGWTVHDSADGLDTLFTEVTGFSSVGLQGWRVARGLGAWSGNDTLVLNFKGNATADAAGALRIGLKGIVNDTSLFKDSSIVQTDTVLYAGTGGLMHANFLASAAVPSSGQLYGYTDTLSTWVLDSGGDKVASNQIVTYLSAAVKSKVVFADSTGNIASTDTAGSLIEQGIQAAPRHPNGFFKIYVQDAYGNVLEDDSTTTITLSAYGSTGQNPPSGLGRLRNPLNGDLNSSMTVAHKGIYGAVFDPVGYTRAGSGIFLKATSSGLTEANSSSVTISQTVAQTVTMQTTEATPHTSPDTMTVGSTKTFEVTVTDSFSNSVSSDTLLVRNALGGTMYTTAPYYFHGTGVTYDATTATQATIDSGLTNSSGKFQFSYTTAGNVGTDTLIVTPFDRRANLGGTGVLTALATRYVIKIVAGAVAQVTITPVTANLNVHSGNYGSSSRYTNKAEVHPDTTTFQGAVIAGDTVSIAVVLKDANGNIKDFASANLSSVTFNTTGRKGSVIGSGVLDTVTIGSSDFVVGKYLYRSKASGLDRDTLRVTYNSLNSPYTIFQTVGGNPYSAALIAPNTLAGTSTVAADTFPVADSLLVMGYVLDKNGNFADSGKTVTWSKVSGGGGFENKYPNTVSDSNSTTTPRDLGVTFSMLGDTLEYFGHTNGLYNFTKDTTLGSGSYTVQKTYIQAKVLSDSLAAEQLVVKASYGTKELDRIALYKQPKTVSKVDLTTGRSTSYSSTQLDTTITSGQTIYLFAKYMDTYYNVITPDTADNSTTQAITWPKTSVNYANGTSFDRTYQQDKIFKKNGTYNLGSIDSVKFVSRASDSLGVTSYIYTDTTVVQSGTAHIRVAYKTLGTKEGYDWIVSYFGTTATTDARDSVYIKTTLPVALAAFRIAVSNDDTTPELADTAGGDTVIAGQPLYVRIIPTDANGNDIFTYEYDYLKLAVTGNTHTDTIKQNFSKTFGRSGIYWAGAAGEITLTDSVDGAAFGSADADCTFTDNTEDFMFYTSNVDAALSVMVWSVPKDTTQNDTISATLNGTIMVKNAPMDTLVLTTTARTDLGYWQDTPFDLNVAVKDMYMNAVLDTGYIVEITANKNGIEGIENSIIVEGTADVRVTPDHQMSGLKFYASTTSDILGNSRTASGYLGDDGSSGASVGEATVNAPASLKGADFPGDAGGYIKLTFPPSANHPGLGTSVSQNLPIDYYMVYRSSSSSAADAVQWSIIPASPLPTGVDSVRSVVSVKGATSTLGYYWVAAVKGDLPAGVIGADLSKAAGVEIPEDAVLGVRVTEEMNLSAAAANESYAVVSEDGGYVVSNLSSRVKARAVDNTLPRGVFTPAGTVITLSDVMIVATVFGDETNYDPVFDVVEDGVIDLRDIIWQIFRLGTAPKAGKEKVLINDGVNQSASLAVESASNSDDVFNLQVSLKGTEEVAGYRFTVNYNKEHYEYIKGSEGDFLATENGNTLFKINDEVEGQITVVGLYTGADYETVDGDGILANMEFAWMGEEMSEITVEDIQLIDASALLNEIEAVQLERPVALPNEFALNQNYPNPFNPTTTIKFSLPEASNVRLIVYNILGQKVRELVNEDMKAGFKRIIWDGSNDIGVKVASGIYIYQIKASNFVAQKKMVFMK